jgi:hypothetical protein
MGFLEQLLRRIGSQTKKLACPVCRERFAEKVELAIHVGRKH